MGFELRMFFADLIIFLPEAHDREMRVLLHDLPKDTCDSRCQPILKHVPGLFFQQEPIDQNSRRELIDSVNELGWPSDVYEQDPTLGLWRLQAEEVTIEPGGRPANRMNLEVVRDRRVYDSAGNAVNEIPDQDPLRKEEEDFSWVAELGQILPGAEVLTSDVLGNPPGEVRVGARVKLTDGKLRTYRVIRDEGKIIPFEFEAQGSKTGAYHQALAELAFLTLSVDSDFVRIQARSFEGSTARSVELRPIGSSAVVDVLVGSFSPIANENTSSKRGEDRIANHFERHYELCLSRPPLEGRPIPVRQPATAQSAPRQDSDLLEPLLAALRNHEDFRSGPAPLISNPAICPPACGGGTG